MNIGTGAKKDHGRRAARQDVPPFQGERHGRGAPLGIESASAS
jgi:hypothetical protein